MLITDKSSSVRRSMVEMLRGVSSSGACTLVATDDSLVGSSAVAVTTTVSPEATRRPPISRTCGSRRSAGCGGGLDG
jgi:hypothetical protein